MRRPALLAALLLSACAGPEADDASLCQDLVHRLCLAPVCQSVTQTLAPGEACEEELLKRTGCGDAAFTFGAPAPTRGRFLECRTPLLRASERVDVAPRCEDVSESFSTCPDLVAFLKGAKP